MNRRLNDAAAAVALLFAALIALWLTSDGTPLPPTIDARIRQTPALSESTSGAHRPVLDAAAWDPFEFGGRPRLAEPQRFLYPPRLQAWASDTTAVARAAADTWLTLISYVLHVWLGALAVYVVVRRFDVHVLAALAVALGYLLAGPLAVPAARVSAEVVFRAAWLPVLAAAVLAGTPASAFALRTAAPYVTGVAVVVVAAGSPRTQAYGLLTFIAAYTFAVAWAPGARGRVARSGAAAMLLTIAISAPASFPTIRLWSAAHRSAGLMSSEPFNGSWRAETAPGAGINPELADALRQLRPSRVMSSCPDIVDAVHLRALGVRSVGGYGGVFPADYATFVNLTRHEVSTASLPYVGMTRNGETRLDLLQFLNAEYQVTCEPAEGELVRHVDEVRIYRTGTLGAAVWTCYPNRVGRAEAEYRLATRRYDNTLSLRKPGPAINVRWAPDVDDAAREAAEARFHLAGQGRADGRTRRYELLDPSRDNVEAMLTSPAVEDTAGLNRETLAFDTLPEPRFEERATEWLVGLEPCHEYRQAALVAQTDDGQTTVDVDAPAEGVVLFSETYDRSRTALVDGRPAPVMRVNLAFTAVPVAAGRHRVHIDLRSETHIVDWVISGVGLVALVLWRERFSEERTVLPANGGVPPQPSVDVHATPNER